MKAEIITSPKIIGTDCPFCGEMAVEDNFCFSCAREIRKPGYAANSFASDIRDMRRVWGETQSEVAGRAGMKPNEVSRLESGRYHHSTKTVQKVIDAAAESEEFTLRVAPKTIPLWAMLHDEGEYLFELMAWKLHYIAERCEQAQRVVDWQKIVKETRRAAIVCRQLADEDLVNPPKIGRFSRGKNNWNLYLDFRFYSRLEYLFKLLRKARCWWW